MEWKSTLKGMEKKKPADPPDGGFAGYVLDLSRVEDLTYSALAESATALSATGATAAESATVLSATGATSSVQALSPQQESEVLASLEEQDTRATLKTTARARTTFFMSVKFKIIKQFLLLSKTLRIYIIISNLT